MSWRDVNLEGLVLKYTLNQPWTGLLEAEYDMRIA